MPPPALDHARKEDKAADDMVASAQKEVDATSRRDERRSGPRRSPRRVGADGRRHGPHRAEEAAEHARAARSRQLAADQEQSQALFAASAARTRAQVLKAHAASLGRRDADPAELIGVAPWSGTEEGAADQAASLGEARSTADGVLVQAQTAVHRALEAVRRVAGEARFAELGGVRQAMAAEAGDSLPGRADQLVRDVGVRLASVVAELAEADKHREGVIERLSTLVEEQLKLAALARRFSRIPAGLGEWSDQQFCRIDFHSPDHVQLSARAGAVVDAGPADQLLDVPPGGLGQLLVGGGMGVPLRPERSHLDDPHGTKRCTEHHAGHCNGGASDVGESDERGTRNPGTGASATPSGSSASRGSQVRMASRSSASVSPREPREDDVVAGEIEGHSWVYLSARRALSRATNVSAATASSMPDVSTSRLDDLGVGIP